MIHCAAIGSAFDAAVVVVVVIEVAVFAEVAADVVVVVVVVVDVVGVRARGATVAKPQGQYCTYISSARNLY